MQWRRVWPGNCIDICIMTTTPPVIQAKITSDPVKLPVAPLLIAIVLGVVVAVSTIGAALYYMLRSGKLPVQSAAASGARPAAAMKTHTLALEPLLVNLADSSGSAYLRVELTLQIADVAEVKEDKEANIKGGSKVADAAVRDTALMVLGGQTSDALLAANGKEQLKKELKAAIAERNPDMRVTDLFFTEFLVQR